MRRGCMSATDEAVVRRYYDQMCNERKNELAVEIGTLPVGRTGGYDARV
jgi:hypothetical protein